MGRSASVRIQDVRGMLGLMGELTELPPDPSVRGVHLVSRLCDLLDAQCGLLAVIKPNLDEETPTMLYGVEGGHVDSRTQRIYREYIAHSHATDPLIRLFNCDMSGGPKAVTRREFVDDVNWYGSEFVNEVKFAIKVDDALYARHPMPEGVHVALGVNRSQSRPVFKLRERQILALLNSELRWFYRQFVSSLGETGANLDRRHRTVLKAVLEGLSEKQVAARLGLSKHTVHDYIKEIYARLGISSRGELFARYHVQ